MFTLKGIRKESRDKQKRHQEDRWFTQDSHFSYYAIRSKATTTMQAAKCN